MYCKTSWYIPHRVIYHQFYGTLSVASIHRAVTGSRDLVSSWQYRADQFKPVVHFIIDMNEVDRIKMSIKDLPTIKELVEKHRSDQFETGWNVVMNVRPDLNKVVQMMMTMIMQTVNTRLKVVPNMDSALDFLVIVDNELIDRLGAAAD